MKDPAALSYHELMTHFVLARGAEIKTAAIGDISDLRRALISTADYVDSRPLASALVRSDHLRNWAEALR